MEEKRIILEKYIKTAIEKLKKANIYVNEKKAYSLIDKYASEKYSLEEAMQEIDKMLEEILEQYKKIQELREEYLNKIEANKELENLPLEYSGITINPQDVDLMNIESAKTPEELKKAINDANNIKIDVEKKLTDNELEQVKSDTYKLYQLTLVDKNEYLNDKNISAKKKIKYLKDAGKLSKTDEEKLDDIIKSSTSTVEIKERLEKDFSKETAHEIYETIHECDPIEKSGIKNTTEEATNNLIDKINNDYNSITIDNAAKYGAVTLGDGTFNYRDLDKCLDFAKGLDKEVRLNALIFYMDCPKELYDLPKTEENRVIVKEKLTSYVDSITKHINENYSDTVRSIDVINEVLNRHPMDGEIKYQYRGDIDQTNANDNTISGWLKHLNMKDLCDVVAVARNNLPETDFMYNDDYLTDPDKLEATKDIMKQITDYEQEHDIRIVDSIGTQMHLDNDVTIEQIENMFRELAIYGLPIEITEFDLAMTQNVEGKTSEEIEALRQQKINEIYNCIENLKQEGINIRGCTIWSKTDSQNFRVTLANEERIANGEEPIDTLHGGYFTENMESKSKQLSINKNHIEYNYHTHTKRCGHAEDVSDAEYVKAAKTAGIKTLGFSDHIPFPDINYQLIGYKMDAREVDEYISSIRKLQKENPDINILVGFEAEYDPISTGFLCDMRDKVDYMILGQHFIQNGMLKTEENNNPNYPMEYANSVCKALDTGLFDIVAHPDIFMEKYSTLKSDEAKRKFEEQIPAASRLICEKAKDMGIPIELNLGSAKEDKGHPNKIFWGIASELGVEVVSGADAHSPSQLTTMAIDQINAENKIGNVPLNKVGIDYNPVKAREKNKKLQDALANTKKNKIPYEISISTQMIEIMMNRGMPLDGEKGIVAFIESEIDTMKNPDEHIEKINNNKELEKFKKQINSPYYKETTEKRIKTFSSVSSSIKKAIEEGKTSKEEVTDYVRKDLGNNNKPKQENKTNKEIDSMIVPPKQSPIQIEKPKTMIKQQPQNKNTNNSNKGSVGILILGVIITIVGIIIMILSKLLTM